MQPSAYRGIKGVTKEAAISRWVRWSNGRGEIARPCALRTKPNRRAAPGRCADGAFQLPLRSPPVRSAPAPERGHGPRPIQSWHEAPDRSAYALVGLEIGRD